ncbi:MAG: MFS transporter [Chloroflexi bacterium]|nr:MFS transporter [Chloroflexota bacterium]MCI0823372.1 MFS transporter [Chloroflexota bacterium]MCI0858290.1 MFS transporter [Chloroflexota bacterium]MCI0866162.1 MFS transporter [Chloroflexota bacterium]MCI0893654.1 MFS transporter [Chloroflexota bacterium]
MARLSPLEEALRRIDYRRVILGTGFTVLFFSGGSRFAMGLMLKPMTDDLGWTRSTVSLAIAAFMLVSALSLPLVGRLVDRFSLRWVMGAGAVMMAMGVGLTGRINSPWQLFAVYGLVYAIGQAATSNLPVGVMISRWFIRRRSVANSVAVSGNATGQLVIIALLAAFLRAFGWRMSFTVLGLVNMVALVPLVLVTVRSRPPDRSGGEGRISDTGQSSEDVAPAQGSILRSTRLWLLIVVYAVCGFQDFFVATHIVAFALDRGIGVVLAGNMLALMGLMGLAGVLLSGVLSDAFGPARPTALCFLIRLGIFAFIIYFQGNAAVIAFALLYGFTFLITAPLTVVYAGSIFGPARLGAVSGTISMVHQIAGGLGAFVGAWIFDQWGSYDRAFGLMLALTVVAMALTLMIKQEKPSESLAQ